MQSRAIETLWLLERAPKMLSVFSLASAGVKFVKDASTVLTASADTTARIWRAGENGSYSAVHTLKVQHLSPHHHLCST